MLCRPEYSVTRCWSNNKQRGTLTRVLVLLLISTQNVHIGPRQRSESPRRQPQARTINPGDEISRAVCRDCNLPGLSVTVVRTSPVYYLSLRFLRSSPVSCLADHLSPRNPQDPGICRAASRFCVEPCAPQSLGCPFRCASLGLRVTEMPTWGIAKHSNRAGPPLI